MIDIKDISFNFIQKEPLSGSYQGMRYYLLKINDQIRVSLYPDRFCFNKTPGEQKIIRDFTNTPDGLNEALMWMNSRYEEGSWTQVEGGML